MKKPFLIIATLSFMLLASACATQPAEEVAPEAAAQEAAASDTPPPEPTETPTEVSRELPETSVVGVLGDTANNTYKVMMGTFEQLAFEDNDLPAPPGSVEAHWYQSGGVYVVAYMGLDAETSGPLCPGNSIRTSSGFEHVSNAPTEEGACEGFTTLTTDPDVGPRVCQGTLLYVTSIPSTVQGTLFGTLESLADDGEALIGMTSQAESSGGVPEIDLELICG